ncbi:MAG TPA: YslB family protein [Candidatus Avamphibacillus sp.]|nr:YslB family protein [Candidatus Avamphibacillus sp.]
MPKQELIPIKLLNNLNTPGAGYDVLRYVGLHDLLGEEASSILYFMGKNLARKFELNSIDDLYYFFDKMGWGKLELVKKKRKEFIFTLLADSIVHRLKSPLDTEFRLEAGFLAEGIQLIDNIECECIEEINYKIHQIQFRVVFTA